MQISQNNLAWALLLQTIDKPLSSPPSDNARHDKAQDLLTSPASVAPTLFNIDFSFNMKLVRNSSIASVEEKV